MWVCEAVVCLVMPRCLPRLKARNVFTRSAQVLAERDRRHDVGATAKTSKNKMSQNDEKTSTILKNIDDGGTLNAQASVISS